MCVCVCFPCYLLRLPKYCCTDHFGWVASQSGDSSRVLFVDASFLLRGLSAIADGDPDAGDGDDPWVQRAEALAKVFEEKEAEKADADEDTLQVLFVVGSLP